MVTAYLTAWNSDLKLNPGCKGFRVIIGKDFGITRKVACHQLLQWLPPKRKGQFLVADGIGGFHPKAVFWKEGDGKCFAMLVVCGVVGGLCGGLWGRTKLNSCNSGTSVPIIGVFLA